VFYRIDVVLLQDVIRVHTEIESKVVIRQVPTGDSDTMRAILRERYYESDTSRDEAHTDQQILCLSRFQRYRSFPQGGNYVLVLQP